MIQSVPMNTAYMFHNVNLLSVVNRFNIAYNYINITSLYSDVKARPERLISRLRTVSLDEAGPRLMVVRQPKGPDGSPGFAPEVRKPRLPGCVPE